MPRYTCNAYQTSPLDAKEFRIGRRGSSYICFSSQLRVSTRSATLRDHFFCSFFYHSFLSCLLGRGFCCDRFLFHRVLF